MTTTRPKIVEHNLETGKVIERAMNDEEFEQYELDQMVFQNEKTAKAEQEAARLALLNRLGITADEAKLLLS